MRQNPAFLKHARNVSVRPELPFKIGPMNGLFTLLITPHSLCSAYTNLLKHCIFPL
jgi:hypothetical protein